MLDPVRQTMKNAQKLTNTYVDRPSQAQELALKGRQQAAADARTRGAGPAAEMAKKQALQAARDAKTRGKR